MKYKHQPIRTGSYASGSTGLYDRWTHTCDKCGERNTYTSLSTSNDCPVPDPEDLERLAQEQKEEEQRAREFLSRPVTKKDSAYVRERKLTYQKYAGAIQAENDSESNEHEERDGYDEESTLGYLPLPTPLLERLFRLGVVFLVLIPLFLTLHYVLSSFDAQYQNLPMCAPGDAITNWICSWYSGYEFSWWDVKFWVEVCFDGIAFIGIGWFSLLPR